MSDIIEENDLLGGHPKAVKVGGMRVVQHKTPHADAAKGKDPVEVIGLSNPAPNVTVVEEAQAPASNKHTNHAAESNQAAHQMKPVHNVPNPPMHNINQPRK